MLFSGTKSALKRYQALVENMSEGFAYQKIILDSKGIPIDYIILEVNEGFAKLLGLNKNQIINKKVTDVLPKIKNSSFYWINNLGKVALTGESLKFEYYSAQMNKWYSFSAFSFEKGFFFMIFHDITSQKLLLNTLKKSEDRLYRAQEIAQVGNWELDLVEKRIWASDQSFKIYGIERNNDYLPLSLVQSMVIPEDRERLDAALYTLLTENKEYSEEFTILRFNDKAHRIINSKAVVERDETGLPFKVLGVLHDITDRKKAEEEIIKLNTELENRVMERTMQLELSNKELESFSYSVSHDLRTPLRGINGFSQALLEDFSDILGPQGKHYLDRIKIASIKMGQLIDDLLKLSHLNRCELNISLIDLSQIVRKAIGQVKMSSVDRNIEFTVAGGIKVYGDKVLIHAAILNLIENSVKFTGNHATAKIEFGYIQNQDHKVLFIRDDGAGFDMAYSDKLFGAFQRLHRPDEFEGNGIGLANVQRIINKHGGKIWAESEVEKGATFYFTLPKVK